MTLEVTLSYTFDAGTPSAYTSVCAAISRAWDDVEYCVLMTNR
jgi:hypothetical protein